MVGVPQQKQGCKRCRKLKKGCDRKRPSCSTCASSNAQCEYIERGLIFLGSKHDGNVSNQTAQKPPDVLLHASLSETARSLGLLDDFWRIYLPDDNRTRIFVDRSMSVPCSQTLKYHAANETMQACAYLIAGYETENRHFTEHSQALYITGLQKVNRSFRDPMRLDVTATVATIKTLSMYERLRRVDKGPTQAIEWRQHIQGLCELLNLRVINSNVDIDHDLVESVHLSSIVVNLMFRTADLDAFTRRRIPPSDSLMSKLLYLADEVPDCMSQCDSFGSLIRNQEEWQKPRMILQQGVLLLDKMLALIGEFRLWEEIALKRCREKAESQNAQSLQDCCADFEFGFFRTSMIYFTIMLILMATTEGLRKTIDFNAAELLQNTALDTERPSLYYAVAVARHAKHFFGPQAGRWGCESAVFPLGVLRRYLWANGLENSTEMEQVRKADRGQGVMTFLLSVMASLSEPDCSSDEAVRSSAKQWFGL